MVVKIIIDGLEEFFKSGMKLKYSSSAGVGFPELEFGICTSTRSGDIDFKDENVESPFLPSEWT